MRRDAFLKSMLALAAAGSLPMQAFAATNVKMLLPANPGGGWDTTGRALGKALQDAGVAGTVTYDNKGGAAGAIGLAQFVNGSKGDPNAMMVMGAVMLGGIITGKPPVDLNQATPLARLTSEYNVFVLPAVGVDPAKINYVAFRGGGEAIAAVLGGNVTVGGSGFSEFAEYIATGKMRPIAVTSAQRLEGSTVPTLKEQGIDVEIGNWRGVYGAPGISADQRAQLIAMLEKATKSTSWAESMKKNDWTSAWLAGDAFSQFVTAEFANLKDTMTRAGMV